MLIYDVAHQRYNYTFLKLCNFLFLMAENNRDGSHSVAITQENIANLLGVGRNHVTKVPVPPAAGKHHQGTTRCIHILDFDRLAAYCSQETQKTASSR